MIDLLAVVDLEGDAPSIGTKLRLDRYAGKQGELAPLARGGNLYLIALRPPPELVWLVAILEQPTFDGTQWIATPSEIPITDITALRGTLELASGRGWAEWCDSCQQTHWMGPQVRTLTAADVALLGNAVGFVARQTDPMKVTPSGKRHGTLLEAILDDTASDEARRIYADQLLADNDPRGEYILIDIALVGPLSIRKRKELAARRAHLLAGYSPIWWPYAVSHWQTQRGFLRTVTGTWPQLEAVATDLFACEPVTEIGITKIDDQGVTALLASPWLARLDRLILRGLPGDAAFAKLASAPELAHLRALNVAGNELGAGAFSGIANALPRVENLVLTGNPIDDDGLEGLRAWNQLPNVHTLYLSSCEIGIRGLDRLLADPLARLATLTLSHNGFGDAGVDVLVKHAAQLPALEHLELKNCSISTTAARRLVDALPNLRRLDARRNELDAELARSDPRIRV